MPQSRRTFLAGSTALLATTRTAWSIPAPTRSASGGQIDPWIEIDPAALLHNLRVVARYAGGRPLLAVVKNNAYGLGLREVGTVLDGAAEVGGFAVVRAGEALALRQVGVRKPILLMARCTEAEAVEAVRHDIQLALFDDDAPAWCRAVRQAAGKPVRGQLYLDTGMARLGRPLERSREWLDRLRDAGVVFEGAFTELTEDRDFDREQVARLGQFAAEARGRGIVVGPLHAASSMAVMHQPETHLALVRPGFALYGGYVSRAIAEQAELVPAFRLRAGVVRMERLETGQGVSYHRRWKATRPTWVATLPLGYVDGYLAEAVKGCEVLIGGRVYPVVGTVSASHTLVAIGDEPSVRVGDVATLIGPDHPAIHPHTIATRTGTSEYGVYFKLSPLVPRVVLDT